MPLRPVGWPDDLIWPDDAGGLGCQSPDIRGTGLRGFRRASASCRCRTRRFFRGLQRLVELPVAVCVRCAMFAVQFVVPLVEVGVGRVVLLGWMLARPFDTHVDRVSATIPAL